MLHKHETREQKLDFVILLHKKYTCIKLYNSII